MRYMGWQSDVKQPGDFFTERDSFYNKLKASYPSLTKADIKYWYRDSGYVVEVWSSSNDPLLAEIQGFYRLNPNSEASKINIRRNKIPLIRR